MSDRVERYGHVKPGNKTLTLAPHPHGHFVLASDYDTLKERADVLADAVEEGREWKIAEALIAYREAGPK